MKNNITNLYYQTGDVLYFVKDKAPNGLPEIKGDLVHKGQNHHHRIKGKFKLLGTQDDMYVVCSGECVLFHEEHEDIVIPRGVYKKSIVMEYDHFLEESREVID